MLKEIKANAKIFSGSPFDFFFSSTKLVCDSKGAFICTLPYKLYSLVSLFYSFCSGYFERNKCNKEMKSCLIGYTGFIGSSLLNQTNFSELYNSKNIFEIHNKKFDFIVCAGAPGKKWVANSNPEDDKQNIDSLIGSLRTVECSNFILISTVDVFKHPVMVDELSKVSESDLHPYGLHRRMLENFVKHKYRKHLVIRLPGLVGSNLKKNALYDLLNDNNVNAIDSRNVYQFYPIDRLWKDILKIIRLDISLIHLTAEPLDVEEIAEKCFKRSFKNYLETQPIIYDVRTLYADIFGRNEQYQYNKEESLQFIKQYAEDEPMTKKDKEIKKI